MIKQFANPSPMLVGEPRPRDVRTTDEGRANHGRETNESRTRDVRTTDERRTNHGRETSESRPRDKRITAERRTFLAPCALTLLRTRPRWLNLSSELHKSKILRCRFNVFILSGIRIFLETATPSLKDLLTANEYLPH